MACRHQPEVMCCEVAELLRVGADPNVRDLVGRAPLHYVIVDAVEATALREANRINHFKRAPQAHKWSNKWVVG